MAKQVTTGVFETTWLYKDGEDGSALVLNRPIRQLKVEADGKLQKTGFEDFESSAITFNPATRALTITPVGAAFVVTVLGNMFTKTAQETIILDNTEGIHRIAYLDDGSLYAAIDTEFDLNVNGIAPVASIVFDPATPLGYLLTDERNLSIIQINSIVSNQTYPFVVDGLQVTQGETPTLEDSLKVKVQPGKFTKNGRNYTVVNSLTPTNAFEQTLSLPFAVLPKFYIAGISSIKKYPETNQNPLIVDDNIVQYSKKVLDTFELAPVEDKQYFYTYIFATPCPQDPIVSFVGSTCTSTLDEAIAKSELVNLPMAVLNVIKEYRLIATVFYYYNAANLSALYGCTLVKIIDNRFIKFSLQKNNLTILHSSILNRDTLDSHPASAITTLEGNSVEEKIEYFEEKTDLTNINLQLTQDGLAAVTAEVAVIKNNLSAQAYVTLRNAGATTFTNGDVKVDNGVVYIGVNGVWAQIYPAVYN